MGQACPPHMRIFLPCTQVSHASCRSANSGRDLWLPHAFHWQRPKLLSAQMGQLWLGEQGGMQGCKRLCNESRILECILLFGVGNIGNTCSSHSCLNEIFLTDLDSCSVSSALFLCGISFGAGWTAAARIPRTTWRAVWGEGRTWYASSREKSVMTESDSFTFNLAMVVPANTAKGSVKELVP